MSGVVEVDRPNRQTRRKKGKSDPTDAISAARAALSGEASVIPKTRDGAVEQIRVLLVARRSAREQRIQSLTQLRHVVFCAPEEIRTRFKDDIRPDWSKNLKSFCHISRAPSHRGPTKWDP